jgi:release factor glutamine methyltransferase
VKDIWTIRKILAWTTAWFRQRGIETPRLDAEILLANALTCDRIDLYLTPDKPLTKTEKKVFRSLIKRRASREPIAYIIKLKEFYGRSYFVDSRVLIPRPETETLIDVLLANKPRGDDSMIADIGVGSGCIAITAALECSESKIFATDISKEAIVVAQKNAENFGLTHRLKILEGAWCKPFETIIRPHSLDVVLSNPPYIKSHSLKLLEPEIVKYEPVTALDGGETGLAAYAFLVEEAARWLKRDGWIIMEIGYDQAETVKKILSKASFTSIMITKDMAGNDRVVSARMGRWESRSQNYLK